MALLGKQIADSGVLKLIQQMLNTTVSNKCGRMSLCRNRP
jgi:hypothetical protein